MKLLNYFSVLSLLILLVWSPMRSFGALPNEQQLIAHGGHGGGGRGHGGHGGGHGGHFRGHSHSRGHFGHTYAHGHFSHNHWNRGGYWGNGWGGDWGGWNDYPYYYYPYSNFYNDLDYPAYSSYPEYRMNDNNVYAQPIESSSTPAYYFLPSDGSPGVSIYINH